MTSPHQKQPTNQQPQQKQHRHTFLPVPQHSSSSTHPANVGQTGTGGDATRQGAGVSEHPTLKRRKTPSPTVSYYPVQPATVGGSTRVGGSVPGTSISKQGVHRQLVFQRATGVTVTPFVKEPGVGGAAAKGATTTGMRMGGLVGMRNRVVSAGGVSKSVGVNRFGLKKSSENVEKDVVEKDVSEKDLEKKKNMDVDTDGLNRPPSAAPSSVSDTTIMSDADPVIVSTHSDQPENLVREDPNNPMLVVQDSQPQNDSAASDPLVNRIQHLETDRMELQSRLDAMTLLVSDLTRDRDAVRHELDVTIRDRDAARTEITSLKQLVEKKNEDVGERDMMIQRLRAQMDVMMEEAQDMSDRYTVMETRLHMSTRNVEKANAMTETESVVVINEMENQQTVKRIRDLETDNTHLRNTVHDMDVRLHDAFTRLDTETTRAKELQRLCDLNAKGWTDTTTRLRNMEYGLIEMSVEKVVEGDTKTEMDRLVDAYKRENGDLRNQLTEMKEEVMETRSRYEASVTRVVELAAEIAAVQQQMRVLQEENAESVRGERDRVEALEKEKTELVGRMDEVVCELQRMKNEHVAEKRHLENIVESVRESLICVEQERDDLHDALQKLNQRISELEHERDNAVEKMQKMSRFFAQGITKMRTDMMDMKNRVADAHQECVDVVENVLRCVGDGVVDRHMHEDVCNERNQLKRELSDMQSRYQFMQSNNDVLLNRVTWSETKLRELVDQFVSIKDVLNDIKHDRDVVMDIVRDMVPWVVSLKNDGDEAVVHRGLVYRIQDCVGSVDAVVRGMMDTLAQTQADRDAMGTEIERLRDLVAQNDVVMCELRAQVQSMTETRDNENVSTQQLVHDRDNILNLLHEICEWIGSVVGKRVVVPGRDDAMQQDDNTISIYDAVTEIMYLTQTLMWLQPFPYLLAQSVAETRTLATETETLRESESRTVSLLHEAEELVDTLQKQLDEALNVIQTASIDIAEKEDRIGELERVVSESLSGEGAVSELARQTEMVQRLRDDVMELQAKYDEMRVKYTDTVRDRESVEQRLTGGINQLQKQVEGLTMDLDTNRDRLRDLETELENARQREREAVTGQEDAIIRLTDTESVVDRLKQEMVEMRKEVVMVQEKLKAREDEMESMRCRGVNLESELMETQRMADDRLNEMKQLNEIVATLKQQNMHLESQMMELQSELDQTKNDVVDARKMAENAQVEMEKARLAVPEPKPTSTASTETDFGIETAIAEVQCTILSLEALEAEMRAAEMARMDACAARSEAEAARNLLPQPKQFFDVAIGADAVERVDVESQCVLLNLDAIEAANAAAAAAQREIGRLSAAIASAEANANAAAEEVRALRAAEATSTVAMIQHETELASVRAQLDDALDRLRKQSDNCGANTPRAMKASASAAAAEARASAAESALAALREQHTELASMHERTMQENENLSMKHVRNIKKIEMLEDRCERLKNHFLKLSNPQYMPRSGSSSSTDANLAKRPRMD